MSDFEDGFSSSIEGNTEKPGTGKNYTHISTQIPAYDNILAYNPENDTALFGGIEQITPVIPAFDTPVIPPFNAIQTTNQSYPVYHAVGGAWNRIVTRDFVKYLKSAFPLESATDFNLLCTILYSVRRSVPWHGIVLEWDLIADCMGMGWDTHRNYLRGKYATGNVLNDFLNRVLPGLEYQDYFVLTKEARELRDPRKFLGEETLDRRDAELFRSRRSRGDLVYLRWKMAAANPARRTRDRQELIKWVDGYIEKRSFPTQKRLVRYLNGLSTSLFKIPEERFEEAEAVVDSWGPSKRESALLQLAAIYDEPAPIYRPSLKKKSARVYTHGSSLATVKRELRPILIPDWIELDLASSQFAIVAKDWNMKRLTNFLEKGLSIWQYLYDELVRDKEGCRLADIKPAFKKGLYASVFGAGRNTIAMTVFHEFLEDQEPINGMYYLPFQHYDFPKTKLIGSILYHRNRELVKIRREEGAVDVFGRELKLGSVLKATSILAQLAQAQELKLLEPVINLVVEESQKKNPRYAVPLWQHDGFSLHVRDKSRTEAIIKKLQQAVDDHKGDYLTHLEVKYPPKYMR